MLAAASDYGPFAPVIGYGGAVVGGGFALFFLWGGKMEKWRPPDENLPGTAQTIVVLLCGVGMALQWYLAVPEAIKWMLLIAGALAVACTVCWSRYDDLLGLHTYYREVACGAKSTRVVRVLGGRELLPEAEKKRQEKGIDIQTLFAGANYNADLLWSRAARQWVKKRVQIFFILTLFLGTSALTGASFAIQVLLSKKAAASVIRGRSAIVPFVTAEDIHLGDDIFPERWGYSHNPSHIAVYPQRSVGLVYFDKDKGQFLPGADNQTHIGQEFVDFFQGVVRGLDFSGHRFVSAYDGEGDIPKVLKGCLDSGQQERVVKLGPTFLYTNDDGHGNFYDRYAAVAVVRAVDFSMPLAEAGMEFTDSTINKIEFLIEFYHGGLRPGQSQNFALLMNGHPHEIKTRSEKKREKEVVRVPIPLSHVNFQQENIVAVFVSPWQEDGPRSRQTGKGPVHFRDVGIINAYFRVAEK